MNQADRQKQPIPSSFLEDIPVAHRDDMPVWVEAPATPPRHRRVYLLWGLLGLVLALLGGYFSTLHSASIALPSPLLQPSPAIVQTGVQTERTPAASPSAAIAPVRPPINSPASPTPETLLGHFAYPEAAPKTLRPVLPDRKIKLRTAAARRFEEMAAAARRDGVRLVLLSGFRSIAEQNYLFFDVKAQQGETVQQRAEVSAPPGYSEHHTGYAIDVADGTRRQTDLQPSFENTPAFRWLQRNAARFSFELSFPRNNPQNISYEPWHWRFVGDRDSLETFYKARSGSSSRSTP